MRQKAASQIAKSRVQNGARLSEISAADYKGRGVPVFVLHAGNPH
jgi:hypothetical protein